MRKSPRRTMIAILREDLKIKQRDLATAIGVPVTTLQSWELGRRSPRVPELLKVYGFINALPSCEGDQGSGNLVDKHRQ